jgi:hypothetical protein
MTVQGADLDVLGPVDYGVVEFPADKTDFSGEIGAVRAGRGRGARGSDEPEGPGKVIGALDQLVRTSTPGEEMAAYKDTLRSLALNDERFVDAVLGMGRDTVEASGLDPKTHALLRLTASLAIDAAPSSYQSIVETAQATGASGIALRDRDVGFDLRHERTLFQRAAVACAHSGGLGDLVPDTGQVGERLGDDKPVALAELLQARVLGMSSLDRGDVR